MKYISILIIVFVFIGCLNNNATDIDKPREASQYLGTYICKTTTISGLDEVYDMYGEIIGYSEDTTTNNYNLNVEHNSMQDSFLLKFDSGNTKIGFLREENDDDLHRDSTYTDLEWKRTKSVKELLFDVDTMYFYRSNSTSFSDGQAPDYDHESGICIRI